MNDGGISHRIGSTASHLAHVWNFGEHHAESEGIGRDAEKQSPDSAKTRLEEDSDTDSVDKVA